MSKYLDFIGQQISQTKSAQGSKNEDSESGIMVQVKKHGVKVAGGLAAIVGGVLAYKHFTKPSVSTPQVEEKTDADHFMGQMLDLQDTETESDVQAFDQNQEYLEKKTPSIEETMVFDEEIQTDGDFMKEMLGLQNTETDDDGQELEKDQEYLEKKTDSIEDLFGLQMSSKREDIDEEESDDQEGSASMDLPGSDLFSNASFLDSSMMPQIEGKFQG